MPSEDTIAVRASELCHRYGQRLALDQLALEVPARSIFAIVGPNGGGKSTFFRILTTLLPMQAGSVTVFGIPLRENPDGVRRRLGVVFQSPSLDGKLTVAENIRYHGMLYGLDGSEIRARLPRVLARLGIDDRAAERVDRLSGGLARRVELAKSLLHAPSLLVLDEPSTGLDPAARADLWKYLTDLVAEGVTVLLTTHLMEEAERAGRVAILDRGRLVASGTPAELRAEVGGEVLTVRISEGHEELRDTIRKELGVESTLVDGAIRLEYPRAIDVVPRIADWTVGGIESIEVARPTLEDVFLHRTGHRFWMAE